MDMDMSTSTLMSMATSTTSALSSATSTAAAGMAGMDGMDGMAGMMGGNACKISMTWNWYTIGACFISDTWQIRSKGMFAGSCIGVICLVISLEFLRRLQREYEAFTRRKDARESSRRPPSTADSEEQARSESDITGKVASTTTKPILAKQPATIATASYQPSKLVLIQRQMIRALLHAVQFAVAYFIMLLAMYYNGYIIISIIIGALLGSFIFSWDQLLNNQEKKPEAADITGCCG